MAPSELCTSVETPGPSEVDFWTLSVRVYKDDKDLGVWTVNLDGQGKVAVDREGIDLEVFWAGLAELVATLARDDIVTGQETPPPVAYQVTEADLSRLLRDGRTESLSELEILREFDS